MAATAHWVTGARQVVGPISGHVAGPGSPAGEPAQLGKPLFTTYLFAFEVTAALLVIAVVGAVVLARRPPTVHARPGRAERHRAAGMSLSGAWYLGLAAVVFTIGAIGLLVRRNVLVMFMCIELMLNAANLTFVTFARMLNDIGGQVLVFFVLVVAAAEVVVGLGIVVTIYRRRATTAPTTWTRCRADRTWSTSLTSCCCSPWPGSSSSSPSGAGSATPWRAGWPRPPWPGPSSRPAWSWPACIDLPSSQRLITDNYWTWFSSGGLSVPVGRWSTRSR